MKPQSSQRNILRTFKEYHFKNITEKIIYLTIEVHSSHESHLLENLYEEAMEYELKSRGIEYKRQIIGDNREEIIRNSFNINNIN